MRQFVHRQSGSQAAPGASAPIRKQASVHSSHQAPAAPMPAARASQAAIPHNHSFAGISIFAPAPLAVQPKLTVGEPGDVFEQEADRIANQVVQMPQASAPIRAGSAGPTFANVQRKCLSCRAANTDEATDDGGLRGAEDEERDVGGAVPLAAPQSAQIPGAGSGQSLSSEARSFMEPRFGFNFGNVRVHTDSRADALAQNLNARAFTVGQDIYFGSREYRPESQEGRQLLAHELTHVVQQSGAADQRSNDVQRSIGSVSQPRIQRYLIGPPQRIGTTTTTPAAYGNCRNFNLVVSWDTDVRNGFIIQECINNDTITRCDGTNVPAPNVPHYWEAWQVDASGTVSDGNADTWFRAGKPGTQGRWTFDANVFAVGALDPAWGFSRGAVATAGGLLATTTGPSHDELYQPSLVRHAGGQWDCCNGNNTHTPI